MTEQWKHMRNSLLETLDSVELADHIKIPSVVRIERQSINTTRRHRRKQLMGGADPRTLETSTAGADIDIDKNSAVPFSTHDTSGTEETLVSVMRSHPAYIALHEGMDTSLMRAYDEGADYAVKFKERYAPMQLALVDMDEAKYKMWIDTLLTEIKHAQYKESRKQSSRRIFASGSPRSMLIRPIQRDLTGAKRHSSLTT